MRAQREKVGMQRAKQPSRGFSLIELLIVIAIILTIAAIAIPSFLRSRILANEATAVQNLRTITTAEVVYSTTYGTGYSTTLAKLGGTAVLATQNQAGLIDEVLATGTKNGYVYTYAVVTTDPNGNVVQYSAQVDPVNPGVTGQRHFYSDQTAVIRQSLTGSAGPSDPPIS